MGILILLALVITCLGILSRYQTSLRESFVVGSVIWGLSLWASTEIFSLFHTINYLTLTIFWGLYVATSLRLLKGFKLPKLTTPPVTLLVPILTLFVTLIICLLAAPNNWDSMTYHLARITYWIQNQSVEHFSANISRQNYMSPFAEYVILQLQVLNGGSDIMANLVQWLGLLGSMIGSSLILRLLGASLSVQVLGAILVGSAPMTLLQATSTQTDLFCGWWVVTTIYLILKDLKSPQNSNIVLGGMALGLGVLTKSTALIFTGPFLLWWLVKCPRKPIASKLSMGALALFLCLLINSGHWVRNYQSYQSMVGEAANVAQIKNQRYGLDILVGNVFKNISLHFATPLSSVNNITENIIRKSLGTVGVDVDDPAGSWKKFSIVKMSNHEDEAGNFIFLLLAFLAIPIYLTKNKDTETKLYTLCCLVSFLIYCLLFKWQPWNSRLHTPVFVLLSVPLAISMGSFLKNQKAHALVAALLFASTLPWLLANKSRPLLPKDGWNLLSKPRQSQYFSNRPDLEAKYSNLIMRMDFNCKHYGIISGTDHWEYPLHRLSKLKIPNVRFTPVNTTDGLKKDTQTPCGVVDLIKLTVVGQN